MVKFKYYYHSDNYLIVMSRNKCKCDSPFGNTPMKNGEYEIRYKDCKRFYYNYNNNWCYYNTDKSYSRYIYLSYRGLFPNNLSHKEWVQIGKSYKYLTQEWKDNYKAYMLYLDNIKTILRLKKNSIKLKRWIEKKS